MPVPVSLQAAVEAAFAVDLAPVFVVDAAGLVPWREVALVCSMEPGAQIEFASGERFR